MFHLKHVQGLYELVDTKGVMGEKKWKSYIDAFLFGCRVNNLTENSINTYAERLGYFVKYCVEKKIDVDNITRERIREYILSLTGQLSDATVNGRIQAIQRFFNYLEEEGIWTQPNPMRKIRRIKTEKKLKQVVSEEEISKAVGATNRRTFIGYRNATMLLLFFDTMILRDELIKLTMENVDLKEGVIRVFGKGRKWREVAMGARMVKMLNFCKASDKVNRLWLKVKPQFGTWHRI